MSTDIVLIPGEPVLFEYGQSPISVQDILQDPFAIKTKTPHCLEEGSWVTVKLGGDFCEYQHCHRVQRVLDSYKFQTQTHPMFSKFSGEGVVIEPVNLTGHFFTGEILSKPLNSVTPPGLLGSVNVGQNQVLVQGDHDICAGDTITLCDAFNQALVDGVVFEAKEEEPVSSISGQCCSTPPKVTATPSPTKSVIITRNCAKANVNKKLLTRQGNVIAPLHIEIRDRLCGLVEIKVSKHNYFAVPPGTECNSPYKVGCYVIRDNVGYQGVAGQPSGNFISYSKIVATGNLYLLPT